MTAQPVYRRSGEVVCRQVGTESILVPIRNRVGDLESIFVLSPVAARIWQILDGPSPAETIVDMICAEFEVDRERAVSDVTQLLDELEQASLVNRVSS